METSKPDSEVACRVRRIVDAGRLGAEEWDWVACKNGREAEQYELKPANKICERADRMAPLQVCHFKIGSFGKTGFLIEKEASPLRMLRILELIQRPY